MVLSHPGQGGFVLLPFPFFSFGNFLLNSDSCQVLSAKTKNLSPGMPCSEHWSVVGVQLMFGANEFTLHLDVIIPDPSVTKLFGQLGH